MVAMNKKHRQIIHNLYLSGFEFTGRQLTDKEIELLDDWYAKGRISYEVWLDAIRLLSIDYEDYMSAEKAQQIIDEKRLEEHDVNNIDNLTTEEVVEKVSEQLSNIKKEYMWQFTETIPKPEEFKYLGDERLDKALREVLRVTEEIERNDES